MKRPVFLFTLACLMLTSLVSCHTSHKSVAHRSSKPKFIDDVYIAPHNKNNKTADAIDRRKLPERSKTGNRSTTYAQNTSGGRGTTYRQNAGNTTGRQSAPANNAHKTTAIQQGKGGKTLRPEVVKKKYSEILGLTPDDITNFALYQFIDKWYGTDYRLGGCDKNGIDCSAFAQRLYGEVYGIDLLRTATEQFGNCKRIKRSKDAEEGDLVFFRIRSKRISHVGVYLANDYFVHASTSGGVMISNLNEEYWHKYYAGCGRVPKG